MSNLDYGQPEPVLTPVFPAPELLTPAAEIDQDGYSETELESGLDEELGDAPDTAAEDDDTESNTGRIPTGAKTRNIGSDRQLARRIATKALALQSATAETRDLLKTLLGSSSDDAVSLTVDIMVGSPSDARRVGNSLVSLRTEFDENPLAAGFAVMELDRDSLEQVWRLVHALGQDIPPRPPAATGKAVRPLANAVSQISASTVTLLTDALALTNRS